MNKELLYKYFKGSTTREEERQLMDWAGASAENYREYLEERKIWNALLIHSSVGEHAPAPSRTRKTFVRYAPYAAAMVVAFVAGIYFFTGFKNDPALSVGDINEPTLLLGNKNPITLSDGSFSVQKAGADIENDFDAGVLSFNQNDAKRGNGRMNRLLVPLGKTYRVALPDGSLVVMNSESELTFPSRFGRRRNVNLKGEAFFEVAADSGRPFTVETDVMDVKVLGTSFNVSCYSDAPVAHVSLVTGSVCIERQGGKQRISPSEQYVYDRQADGQTIRIVDTELYTSWTKDMYIFRDATLEEIFIQLSHQYKFVTHYASETLKDRRFSFKAERTCPLEKLLQMIGSTEEVSIEKTGNNIYINNFPAYE